MKVEVRIFCIFLSVLYFLGFSHVNSCPGLQPSYIVIYSPSPPVLSLFIEIEGATIMLGCCIIMNQNHDIIHECMVSNIVQQLQP
ncbi:hypothetical protein GLYMA_03G011333v4 [Glycine max]|nr:hypothetical protein GLYMA_03G011333v4 [Glycine max]